MRCDRHGFEGCECEQTPEQQVTVNELVSDLPTVEEAGNIAVGISENLPAQEQAFFVAGFQECIKYLSNR